jgi:peptidoglycan/LPS O-acetylase OafA/YrhL
MFKLDIFALPLRRRGMGERTIGSELDRTGGILAGADGVRVALALLVVVWHQHTVLYGAGPGGGSFLLRLISQNALPVFFGLGGFMIAASALRLSKGAFLVNRMLRIVPALAVEIVLSAFLLGPVFTALPLWDYFTDAGTYAYLSNIVGVVNYTLPGVFAGNPVQIVNASLWTIPYEFVGYGIALAAMVLGIHRRHA